MDIRYKWLLVLLVFGYIACDSDDDASVKEEVVITSGMADFSKYVALGNSLTAGFTDGALFIAGQENSMANILAQQFALAGGGDFTQPLMDDNVGGALLGGTQVLAPRFFFNGEGPAPLPAVPTTEISNGLTGVFNNMGIPGAKSFHLLANGYGNIAGLSVDPAQANPYFVRMASNPNASVLEDAMAQSPTFFSLWIGNNDILGYATSGGDGSDSITDVTQFTQAYEGMIMALTSGNANGVLFNIPNVTSIPFFTTVPNNALVLNASQAASLTGFFQAVAGIVTGNLQLQGVDEATAQMIASQYAITFKEGANRWIIDAPVTQANPLGFKQMSEEGLLLLTIDRVALEEEGYGAVALTPEVLQVLGILQMGGTPTQEQALVVLDAVNGIDDRDVLDIEEVMAINEATEAFNNVIASSAQTAGLAFVDANLLLSQLADTGLQFDEFLLRDDLVFGGAFSLDGVHPSARGYAFIANKAIESINEMYGSNIPIVKAADYPVLYSATLQ